MAEGVTSGRLDESIGALVTKLAAKARIVEALSSGDLRVLAAELREQAEELHAMCGGGADVITITKRGGR